MDDEQHSIVKPELINSWRQVKQEIPFTCDVQFSLLPQKTADKISCISWLKIDKCCASVKSQTFHRLFVTFRSQNIRARKVEISLLRKNDSARKVNKGIIWRVGFELR